MYVHQMPITEARPLDRLVRDVKAQGLDEMERAASGRAGAGHIAGVHGDLGFDQDDIYHTQVKPLSIDSFPAHYIVTQWRRNYNIKNTNLRKIFLLFQSETAKISPFNFTLPLCPRLCYDVVKWDGIFS